MATQLVDIHGHWFERDYATERADNCCERKRVEARIRADITNDASLRDELAEKALFAILVNAEPLGRIGGAANPKTAAIDPKRHSDGRVRGNEMKESPSQPEKSLQRNKAPRPEQRVIHSATDETG